MNAHERAEKLFIEAERLGMEKPSEGMVAEAINDAESNEWNSIHYELANGGFKDAAKFIERLQKIRFLEEQDE